RILVATAGSGAGEPGAGHDGLSITGAIEPDQAVAIFAEFAASEDLALRFPADRCYARTHVMVRRLLDRRLAPSKVWAFAASATDLLWTDTPDHPDGRVYWGYHVAPGSCGPRVGRRPAGDGF